MASLTNGGDEDNESDDDKASEGLGEAPFPSDLEDVRVGCRVDALDHRGQWFAGQVVAIDDSGCRRVHFDRFSAKWDEWYGEAEWKQGKLAAPLSKSKHKVKVLELQVVHRREATARNTTLAPNGKAHMELFGTPFVVRVAGDRSCRSLFRVVARQAALFVNKHHKAWGHCARGDTTQNAGGGGAAATPDEDALPFRVKVASLANPSTNARRGPSIAALGQADKGGDSRRVVDVEALLATPAAAVSDAVDERRVCIALDWRDCSAYDDPFQDAPRHQTCLDVEDDERRDRDASAKGGERREDDGIPLSHCLDAFSKEETLSEADAWICELLRRLFGRPSFL